ncbi:response regulator [Candidatus Thiosymbion oneisti]|uniref:response regulator n=1 Tax=Candidatus Thiosymbion oneisti TaxID=589554 RepID=UPI000B09BA0C|nr:response regulator [Candidatus Thiosymbion oneisti]
MSEKQDNNRQGKQTLLVIDDNEIFRESIELKGKDQGWNLLASDDIDDIRHWLSDHVPDIVLFDWQLPGEHRRDYARMLQDRGLTSRTLLLSSAEIDNARRRFIERYGLAGYKLKPLDMDQFETEIQPLPHREGWEGLETVANRLDVCIDILDRDLNPSWSNAAAKRQPATFEQRLIIKWLRADLTAKEQKATRRLDWIGEQECFLESRLFALGTGGYWLAREWRAPSDRPHDHELLNLEKSDDLQGWFRAIAELLAQRYAISRFRVYKIAPLPCTEGLEEPKGPLVMPLFQAGGGFRPSVEVWHRSGFLATENPCVKDALVAGYKSVPEYVDDGNSHIGCKEIGYGPTGTYRVQFPVCKANDQPVALFVLDRRLDHIKETEGFDRKVVDIATRMASDEAGSLNPEQCSLMKGLVEDIGKRLMTARLNADEDLRSKNWHEAISRALQNTFAETGRSPEMVYEGLSQVCVRLMDAWKKDDISGRILGTTSWDGIDGKPPISTWYIALLTDDTHWQAVAGVGDSYDQCRREGQQGLSEPHRIAVSTAAWQAVVVQDFQSWLEQTGDGPYRCIRDEQRRRIASWLAIPMQVDGKIRALMVVHSPHTCYFTAFRVQLLEQAAKRLLPLLAAAQREIRTRSAFTAAVMHEVKNDSHAALLLLREIEEKPRQSPSTEKLTELRHYLEGLNGLGQDALDVFQLGREEKIQDRREHDQDQIHVLGKLIEGMILGWRTLYEDTRLEIDFTEDLAHRRVEVMHALSFRRVGRVLMHNAFRHGRDWVRIRVELRQQGNNEEAPRLVLTIANLAYDQVAGSLAEHLNLAEARIGSSPLARGRLGLAVARQLTTEAGGTLGKFETKPTGDEDEVQVRISLSWPIQLITENPGTAT